MDLYNWIMYVLMPLLGIVFVCGFIPLTIIVYKKVFPKVSRDMLWAKLRGTPPAIICHDSGRADIQYLTERRGAGVMVTNKGKYKLVPRFTSIDDSNLLAVLEKNNSSTKENVETTLEENTELKVNELEKQDDNAQNDDTQKSFRATLQKKINYLKDYSDYFSRRSMLMGLGLPIFFGYSGSLCLLNPDALALYEAGEMKVRVDDIIHFKGDSKKENDAPEPLMLLDPRTIKAIINMGFDETQIAAIQTDSELVGQMGKPLNLMNYAMIFIIVIIVALAVYFLPQLLPKGK